MGILSATPYSSGNIGSTSWVQVLVSSEAGASLYKLYRGDTAEGEKAVVGTSAGTMITDESAGAGTTYYYASSHVAGGEESALSEAVSVSVPAAYVTADDTIISSGDPNTQWEYVRCSFTEGLVIPNQSYRFGVFERGGYIYFGGEKVSRIASDFSGSEEVLYDVQNRGVAPHNDGETIVSCDFTEFFLCNTNVYRVAPPATGYNYVSGAIQNIDGKYWVCANGIHRVYIYDESLRYIGNAKDSLGNEIIYNPNKIAHDAEGNVYVSSIFQVKIYNKSGVLIGSFGENGSWPGAFGMVNCIAADSNGNVWAGDNANANLQRFDKYGKLTGVLSNSTGDGHPFPGLGFPSGLWLDSDTSGYITFTMIDRSVIGRFELL
jgi:sugar lactone lactonase YvrE